jgi:hypothetical protein
VAEAWLGVFIGVRRYCVIPSNSQKISEGPGFSRAEVSLPYECHSERSEESYEKLVSLLLTQEQLEPGPMHGTGERHLT